MGTFKPFLPSLHKNHFTVIRENEKIHESSKKKTEILHDPRAGDGTASPGHTDSQPHFCSVHRCSLLFWFLQKWGHTIRAFCTPFRKTKVTIDCEHSPASKYNSTKNTTSNLHFFPFRENTFSPRRILGPLTQKGGSEPLCGKHRPFVTRKLEAGEAESWGCANWAA